MAERILLRKYCERRSLGSFFMFCPLFDESRAVAAMGRIAYKQGVWRSLSIGSATRVSEFDVDCVRRGACGRLVDSDHLRDAYFV